VLSGISRKCAADDRKAADTFRLFCMEDIVDCTTLVTVYQAVERAATWKNRARIYILFEFTTTRVKGML
jgi:hypothetical protein